MTGKIIQILPKGGDTEATEEVLSAKEPAEYDDEYDTSEAESENSGVFGMGDMQAELTACEEQMSQFMRLNILFSQISTVQFAAFANNATTEYEQLPKNPARDFFLKNVCFDPFFEGIEVSVKLKINREFHQMAYLLNIQKLQMRLDSSDWRVISRVMLTEVTRSLASKMVVETAQAELKEIAKVQALLGPLTDEEQIY